MTPRERMLEHAQRFANLMRDRDRVGPLGFEDMEPDQQAQAMEDERVEALEGELRSRIEQLAGPRVPSADFPGATR